MSLPSTPRGALPQRRVHFRFTPTDRGSKWHAWIAGPALWIASHTQHRSTPCCTVVTKSKVKCERCAKGHTVETIGYVPLYRDIDWKPVCVIVHEDQRDVCDKLWLHAFVLIGRQGGSGDGVWLRPTVTDLKFETTLPERKVEADITESCLTYWKLPEFEAWYRQSQFAKQPQKVTLPCHSPTESEELARIERETPEVLKKARDEGLRNRVSPETAIGMGEVVNGMLNNTKVKRNGTH